ncbi:MAG: hypothetical protein GVY12_02335 [Bacteroidetes bacterium]|jgi:flagellar biosynthesis/type III secretory pathway protein FliH|nr:hypothetical protein [Bacteroidota bacterium]
MSNHPSAPRVIKARDQAAQRAHNVEATHEDFARPQRIPREATGLKDGPAEEPPALIPGHVLERERTVLQADPFEIPAFDALPEHPLPPPPESDTADDAPVEEAPPEPTVEEQLAEARAAWEEEQEQALEQARAEAFAAGEAAAREAMEAEVDARAQHLTDTAERLTARWDDFLDDCEPLLATLAFDVAEAVLDGPLPDTLKGTTRRALTEALDALAGTPPLRISLHPVDYLRLQEDGTTDLLSGTHDDLRWNPDPAFREGDWEVQAADASIRHVREEMIQTLQRRLGLLELMQQQKAQQAQQERQEKQREKSAGPASSQSNVPPPGPTSGPASSASAPRDDT